MPDPSADWNRPYRKQEQCAQLAPALTADPPVRYADGTPVGSRYLVPREPGWKGRTTSHSNCRDRPGAVRIDLTEVLAGNGAGPSLYFHKGGQGYDPASVPYGHLDADVLATPPQPVFTKDQIDLDGAHPGNNPRPGAGRAHPVEVKTYRVKALPIGPDGVDGWLYKDPGAYPPGKNLRGCRYSKYGDAGPSQGEDGDQHFVYLCWSWTRQDGLSGERALEVRGGGAVRALLAPGQIVHRCDVESVTAPAWDRDGNVVGSVTAVYVRAPVGGNDLYGWIPHSHQPEGGRRQMHVATVG
jgi:hypothetical protein